MKLLFVRKRYHSNQHYAMKSLLAHGHKIDYFVQDIGPSENHGVLVPKTVSYSRVFLLIERVTYKLFRYKISRSSYGFPRLGEFYRAIRASDPDVLIVWTGRLYSQVAIITGKILKKPVVLNTENALIPGLKNRTRASAAKRLLARLAVRPRVSFTPVSGVLFGEKPTRHRSNYYIPLVVEPSPVERLKSYRKDRTIKIICVAKYQDFNKKRHDLLIHAFRDLVVEKSYKLSLTFVGSGKETDHRLRYLRSLVEDLNLHERVVFRLNIPHESMNELYAAHDLFVLPSRREGYGYSLLEAMASGLPVIASDHAGASDCIEHGVNGYIFKSDDLESLTDAIKKVIDNPDVLEEMGHASREIVQNRYLPDVYHDRLMYLLKEEFGLADPKIPTSARDCVRASG